MSKQVYDYAIVGAGAAGIHLILKMISDDFFQNKKILVIDKNEKTKNDRTWCFWEKEKTWHDELVAHQWKKATVIEEKGTRIHDLFPYIYKMIYADDLYRYAHKKMSERQNIRWVEDKVMAIEKNEINILEFGSGFSTRFLVDYKLYSNKNITIDTYDNDAKYAFNNKNNHSFVNVNICPLISTNSCNFEKQLCRQLPILPSLPEL